MGKAVLMLALPIIVGLLKDDYAKLVKGDVGFNDSRGFINELCKSLNLCSWPKLIVIETAVYPISQILDLPVKNLEDIFLGMAAMGEVLSREAKVRVITITRSGGFRENEYSKIVPMPQWPKHPGEGIFVIMGILPVSIMGNANMMLNWYEGMVNEFKGKDVAKLSREFMNMYKLTNESIVFLLPPIANVDAGELRSMIINDALLMYDELEGHIKRYGVKVRTYRI
ncbi:hypothetical protein [Caldivirga sp. UBA161]|uniref:hypothetical protein n=1 Tax=Caldivirga sp. UBA161 TaxID=1915569 RepID=UPI0025C048A8|nr:hypothetical protein [Caldivirga sp. UBA161]